MARRRAAVAVVEQDSIDDVADWYRRELRKTPVLPWAKLRYKPVTIGPTWQLDGRRWLLPEYTLGWDMLGWCGVEMQHGPGEPWRFTLEQARFILWWYALDADGNWLFRDFVLQRLKGWGKDPLAATICGAEMLGPCRFADWDRNRPVASDQPHAWVQTAAVSLEQTKNTMRLFPSLFTPEAKSHYGIQVGKELIHGLSDDRLIQATTSSPTTLEGNRSTFNLLNETQHWQENNQGHAMAEVIARNSAKSPDGAARTGRITNAPDPSIDSVARRDRDAYDMMVAGESATSGILYDSLEASPEAPLTAEDAPDVLAGVRGDAKWLSIRSIVDQILDTRNAASTSRRFWYNAQTAAEDAWVDPQRFDALARPELGRGVDLLREARVAGDWVVFFDGSKSDDATGIVGCRISDGHTVTLGMWQRPPLAREDAGSWTVPRDQVDERVTEIMERLNVVGFWADPSHTRDDETQERYWDDLVDGWHRRYRDRLKLWATPGKGGHSTMWDMASPARSGEFTAAAERTQNDIDEDGTLTWDGDPRLRIHTHNAKRYPNRHGVSLWKGHRESKRKIDLAVCMVGARMMRRAYLNMKPEEKRSGVVW
jgi:hypothetical protein